MKILTRLTLGFSAWAILLSMCGCRSYESHWIDASVENQTGQRIKQLEVAYPSASFGANSLDVGASMHYRFQIRNSGPVKVEYSTDNGKTVKVQGLTLVEHQQGQLTIRLQPEGKIEFIPQLQPAS